MTANAELGITDTAGTLASNPGVFSSMPVVNTWIPLTTTQIIVNRPKNNDTLETEFSSDIDVMQERTKNIAPTHNWQYR